MTAFLTMILAALPNVFLAILGKIVTEDFMQGVMEKVLLAALKKAAAMTTNTVDDEIVSMIENRLKDGGGIGNNQTAR